MSSVPIETPFPPRHVAVGVWVHCGRNSTNSMENVTAAGRRQPNILIVHETSESGVSIPADIPADMGGTKRPMFLRLPRDAFDTRFTK